LQAGYVALVVGRNQAGRYQLSLIFSTKEYRTVFFFVTLQKE